MKDTGAVEVWRGGVNAWECDEMGHLNVRFHLARAMQGLAGVAFELGMPHAVAAHGVATLIVREHHVRFLREARAGAPLHMTAGVLTMDECEAVILQTLTHTRTGLTAATFTTRVVHAASREGRPFPWPGRAREAAETLKVGMAREAEPRSLHPTPGLARPTLAQAKALEMAPIGLSVIQADETDVFGRMRTELFMGKISDGISEVVEPLRTEAQKAMGPGVRVGGAAVEYRLTYFDHPMAGDHLQVRSGFVAVDSRVATLRHWLLDPRTGEAWAAADHISVNFDLDARKAIPLAADAVERLQARVRT